MIINKLAKWVTKHPKTVLLVAVLLVIPSAIGFLATPVNYDILSYLPDELESVEGINSLDEDFGLASMSVIIMDDMTWDEMSALEDSISATEHVKTAMWLGTIAESPIPLSIFPSAISSMLYSADGDSTLMLILYDTPSASNETLDTVAKIKELLPEECLMSGTSAMTYDFSDMTEKESPKFIAIAVALALIALGFTMESFLLPFVLLASLGLAIIYNMGTNFMFGEISFVTQSIAAILQLGVTMDYSVFLMDRYAEEKPKYRTRQAAMAKAITSTFTSLAGSSLTTIFGFLALCFMSLKLGVDIGLVMAKGVLLGIVTVVIVLPALLLLSEKFLIKTRHKSLIPSFNGLNKITLKFRRIFVIIVILLIIPSWYGQNNVKKYYNMMEAIPDSIDSIQALNILKDDFNMASTYFVIADNSMEASDKLQLLKDLEDVEGVTGVMGLNSVLGTAFSEDILPDAIASMLISDGRQVIIVNSQYSPATDQCNAQVEELTSLIKSYDPEALLTGEAPMYKDLVEVTDRDFVVTNAISIIAIFLLIAIIFKSISVPFILVMSIELAIWINLALSFVTGEVICFITPTIISCVQLGATVDYAILLTTRFREELQKGTDKKTAMLTAANSAHRSIFQSALVFFAATIGVYLICDIDIVRSICAMLARGAVISALVIMLFLPPLLVTLEGFINKTSYKWREVSRPTYFTTPMLEKMQKNMEKARKKAEKRIEKSNKAIKKNLEAASSKKTKKGKAIPVPAQLVTKELTKESAEAIEKAMGIDKSSKNSETENNLNGDEDIQ